MRNIFKSPQPPFFKVGVEDSGAPPFEKGRWGGIFPGAKFFLLLVFIFTPFHLHAFPNEEKAALELEGVNSQATTLLLQDDQFFFLAFDNDIFRFDTQTFDLTEDQIPELVDNSDEDDGDDLSGNVGGLAIQGNDLFISQADGDLITVDLDDITAAPTTQEIISGTLGPLVADNEGGGNDNKLYILDKTNNAVRIFTVSDPTNQTVISLLDGFGVAVTPVSAVFVPFPTDSSGSTVDKVFVTTNRGLIFVINEGDTVSSTITLTVTSNEFPEIAASPGGDFVFVVDSSDDTIHVIDTATNTEVDGDPLTGGVNPIEIPENSGLKDVVVPEVENPDDIFLYVTGSQGLSVIDLDITLAGIGTPDIQDLGTDEGDPLTLSASPGLIVASSADDGYVYTSNGDTSISVISENPFVTIGSTSLNGETLSDGESFTLTFQSDETGTFRVVVGGDETGTGGTQVSSGTVSTADSNITTDAISESSGLFVEGDNRVFIFVTDSGGRVGRDAVDITVDTPPPPVVVLDSNFGTEKIFVTFERLDISDVDHYNIFLDPNFAVAAAKTDVAATVTQPASGNKITVKVTGLTNNLPLFIGVEAVDAGGQEGTRTLTFEDGSPVTETPERTTGLIDFTGETGCALIPEAQPSSPKALLGLTIFVVFGLMSLRFRKTFFLMVVVGILFMPLTAKAAEETPENWSFEVKSGVWLPTFSVTRDILGTCCDLAGAVEFGYLHNSKFGLELGTGFINASGTAIGATSQEVSGDRFSLIMIPIYVNATFRADFKKDQFIVPYVKAGPDYEIFRENTQGVVTSGAKYGLHLTTGLQILLDGLDDFSDNYEGINDVYFTLEGRYAWINNFAGLGVDLSGLTLTGGLLFQF